MSTRISEEVTLRKEKLKKDIGFAKIELMGMFVFLFIFVVVILIVFINIQIEPVTLITCVFAFCGIEGGCLAWIKTNSDKLKKELWILENLKECPDCKEMIEKESEFCSKCGHRFDNNLGDIDHTESEDIENDTEFKENILFQNNDEGY